jgi:sigma-54 dependent transcriptional regulator, acetoin dehydrogenase operon transcriptional activator AcoR
VQAPSSPPSDVTADEPGPLLPDRDHAACLTLAFQAEAPLASPLCALLSDVDAVWMGRGHGTASAARAGTGGERQLRIEVPDRFLSASHASLQRVFGRWLLEDMGSRNGTFVDGGRVERFELRDGTVFEIGHSFFVFRAAAPVELEPVLGQEGWPGSLQPAFAAQLRALGRAAATSLPIVVRGETGTGKEVLARLVHARSGRPGAFQAINCAALPASLIESELFGYRKGAFSGATEDRPGLVRGADKGTLFLDEVGDLPLPAQGALLRVLQESEVLPVGGTRAVPVDFRLVVATHRNLEAMAAAGQFRPDLLARMSGLSVTLPPLRERKEDLGSLVAALLRRLAPDRTDAVRFTMPAARALFRYEWPLNVRELEKALALALALSPEGAIDLAHLPPSLRSVSSAPTPETSVAALPADELQRREELVALLREHRGNVTAVARVLGKARVQVQRWMRRYRIQPAIFR